MLGILIVGVILAVIGVVLLGFNRVERYNYDRDALGKSLLTVGLLLVVIIGVVYIGTTVSRNVYAEKVEHNSLYTAAGFYEE